MTTENNTPKLLWKIDSTHPEKAQELRAAFKEVVDPELGLSAVELGLIRDVVINGMVVEITMILTTPFCPYGPALLEMARQKAESALKMPATIEMGLEMWGFSMMEEGAGAEWNLF
jgi:metal-sulfur cluster biosynthetic enzyme